jgi:DNA damage-inducible protein 1
MQIQSQEPGVVAAIDDPVMFAAALQDSYDRNARERAERERELARLNDDPFNVEHQRRIEEIIRQERVMENLQNAMEHNPEGEDARLSPRIKYAWRLRLLTALP